MSRFLFAAVLFFMKKGIKCEHGCIKEGLFPFFTCLKEKKNAEKNEEIMNFPGHFHIDKHIIITVKVSTCWTLLFM